MIVTAQVIVTAQTKHRTEGASLRAVVSHAIAEYVPLDAALVTLRRTLPDALGSSLFVEEVCSAIAATFGDEVVEPKHVASKLELVFTQVTDAGCATLAAALDSGALPALEELRLDGIPASAGATDAVRRSQMDLLLSWPPPALLALAPPDVLTC